MHRDESARLEKELLTCQEENLALQDELSKTRLKLLELEAKEETTSSAVCSLEKTLQQIEKGMAQRQNFTGRSMPGPRHSTR